MSAGLIIYALIFSLYIGTIYPVFSDAEIQMRANLFTFFGLALGGIFGLINITHKGLKKFLVLLADIYYEAVIYTISSLVMSQLLFFNVSDKKEPYTVYNVCTLLAVTAATAPIMWRIMAVKLRDVLSLMNNRQLRRSCILMSAELILYIFFIFLMPSFKGPVAPLMISCCMLSNVLSLYSFLGEVHMARVQMQMEEKLRMFDLEYASIKSNIEEMSRFRHDMRHHFDIIATLNTEGRSEELGLYLKKYVRAYESFEESQICGYPQMNTILKYYLERCSRENIRIKTKINLNEKLELDAVDVTVLMGNCLENAINACLELPEEDRYVSIEMMKMNENLLIYLENSCRPGRSAKASERSRQKQFLRGRWHGYGTDSICKIAEKYGGSAEFLQEGRSFVTRIVLNLDTQI